MASKIATKVLDFDASSVEFTFEGKEPRNITLASFSQEIQLHFALHGMSQKLGDSYSSAKGDVAVAEAAFDQTLAQLNAGEWRAARGEGDAKPRTTELAAAIARIKNVPVEDVVAKLAASTDEERKTLRSNERVKATIAVLRAEKAQERLAKLDAAGEGDELLG